MRLISLHTKAPVFAAFGWSIFDSKYCSLLDPKKDLCHNAFENLEVAMTTPGHRWRFGCSEVNMNISRAVDRRII